MMKQLKYISLVLGLVLIGAGCTNEEESLLTIESDGSVIVVNVGGEGEGSIIVEALNEEELLDANDEIEEVTEGQDPIEEPAETEPVVNVNFTVQSGNFFYEPSSLRVKVDDTVNLLFSENSGTHDFVIDEIRLEQMITEGESITFTAPTEPGSYAFYCSIGSHRALGMEGILIVE